MRAPALGLLAALAALADAAAWRLSPHAPHPAWAACGLALMGGAALLPAALRSGRRRLAARRLRHEYAALAADPATTDGKLEAYLQRVGDEVMAEWAK